MGIAVVEAMAAGIPVVATRVGGIPEVVLPGTGLLVEPSDAVGMAESVARILREPHLRDSLASAAMGHVREQYSSRRMAQRTLAVYAAVLARNSGAPMA
jgi:glycosyltransferase involved in cell wall biosynthesis